MQRDRKYLKEKREKEIFSIVFIIIFYLHLEFLGQIRYNNRADKILTYI